MAAGKNCFQSPTHRPNIRELTGIGVIRINSSAPFSFSSKKLFTAAQVYARARTTRSINCRIMNKLNSPDESKPGTAMHSPATQQKQRTHLPKRAFHEY